MYASSTQSAGHIARRERLGVFEAKPLVRIPRTSPAKVARDIIEVMSPLSPEPEEFFDIPGNPIPAALMWRQIIREVCEKHKVSYIDLCSHRRNRPVVIARHEASWRLKNETTMSYPQIGKKLGGRDHTTIINGVLRYERMLAGEQYRDTHGRSAQT